MSEAALPHSSAVFIIMEAQLDRLNEMMKYYSEMVNSGEIITTEELIIINDGFNRATRAMVILNDTMAKRNI